MSSSQVTAAFTPSQIKKGLGASAGSFIQTALAGGSATSEYFATKNQIFNIASGLNNNTVSWVQTTTKEGGQPAYFAQLGTGSDAIYLSLASNIDQAAVTGAAPTQQFTWNGQSYNVVGSIQLSYSAGSYGWVTNFITGVVGTASWPAMTSVITKLVSNALLGTNQSLGQLDFSGQNAINVGELDEAGTNGLLSEDAIAEISAAWGCFLGPIAAVGITVLVQELLHYTQHSFTIVNLTSYDVTWANVYSATGSEMTLGPVTSASTGTTPDYVTDYVIPGGQESGPPALNPQFVNSDADFQFTTATGFTGLGYVFTLSFTDTSANASYTATFMFDLPWMGENSLAATFDSAGDPATWYSENEGANRVVSLTAKSSDGLYQLTLTYDLLSGEQPGPGNAGTGYFYNSLVVLQSVS